MYNKKEQPLIYLPPLPRQYRKYVIAQAIFAIFALYIWYTLNGGFIPQFLLPRLPYFHVGSDVGCLVFFSVSSDASKIKWAREANSQQRIQKAVQDETVHMIAGDVQLYGQGSKSQALIPVMTRPTKEGANLDSDYPLKDWLKEVKFGSKGIKLHLHSKEAVEISLQILSEFNKQNPIKYPVWIHADILQGPHGGPPTIDYKRFFKALNRLFPKCTLSLGWTTGTHTDLSQSAYTWQMVWDMMLLAQEWVGDDRLVVFQARLSLIHNSVPQLKWLCDNIKHSSLMIWHEDGDMVVNEDIMYIAYRFPPHSVYFDLNHQRFETLLSQYRHFSRSKVDHYVLMRDEKMFHPGAWLKVGFHTQKSSILASTEAIILAEPISFIVSKGKYAPTSEIFIQGRVQFLNRNQREAEDYHTGLDIYLRPTEYKIFDSIVGIRCFIGVGGEIEITGSNLPDKIPKFRQFARVTPTYANCYKFKIVNDRTQIRMSVKSFHDCTTLESVEDNDEMPGLLTVDLPRQLMTTDHHPVILRTEDVKRQAIIDELSIKHK